MMKLKERDKRIFEIFIKQCKDNENGITINELIKKEDMKKLRKECGVKNLYHPSRLLLNKKVEKGICKIEKIKNKKHYKIREGDSNQQNSVGLKIQPTEIKEKETQLHKEFKNILNEFKNFDDEKRISSIGIYTGLDEDHSTFSNRKKSHWDMLEDCVITIKTISPDGKYYDKDYWDETGFILHCMWSHSKEAKKFQKWGKIVFKNVLNKGIHIDEKRMNNKLQENLLNRVHKLDSNLFESLALDIIIKTTDNRYKVYEKIKTGKTGDGGIDGVVYAYKFDDDLGLDDRILMQAKNWNGGVGIDPIQRFKGSLNDVLADKGVFITSGYFTKSAIKFAKKGKIRISLINGIKLVNIMIKNKLGILSKEYKIIDEEYFNDLELTYKTKEEETKILKD